MRKGEKLETKAVLISLTMVYTMILILGVITIKGMSDSEKRSKELTVVTENLLKGE